MGVHEIEQALQRAMSRRRRLAAARAAVAELTDDERDELLSEMIESKAPVSQPTPTPTPTPAPVHRPEPLKLASEAAALADGGSAIKDAIASVLTDSPALTTGRIADLVVARFPHIKRISIPAAVSRMANAEPPLLVIAGKNERGHALYAIAPSQRGAVDVRTDEWGNV